MPGVVAGGQARSSLGFLSATCAISVVQNMFPNPAPADPKTGASAKRRIEVLRAKQYYRGETHQLHYGAHTFC